MITALLSAVSFVCCLLAFCLHSLHLYLLFIAIPTCSEYALDRSQSPSWLLDLMDVTKERNDQHTCLCPVPSYAFLAGDTLTYIGLSCVEVKRVLPAIITVAAVLNFVGLFISAWFCGLVTLSSRKADGSSRFRDKRSKAKKTTPTVAAKGVSANDAEAANVEAALLQS